MAGINNKLPTANFALTLWFNVMSGTVFNRMRSTTFWTGRIIEVYGVGSWGRGGREMSKLEEQQKTKFDQIEHLYTIFKGGLYWEKIRTL